MAKVQKTIAERLQDIQNELTRAERQLASSLLANYPMSGLSSITAVAEHAEVSTPTVIRMVRKLGFEGYPQFQAELRKELEATITTPITRHEKWAGNAPDTHILNEFTGVVVDNIQQSLSQIDPTVFDQACQLLSDQKRSIYITGGRITRALADYFFMHLQMIRKHVHNMESRSSSWPHYILDMNAGDVLVMFDVRRYENSSIKLAELAKNQKLKIILFTDQWRSPVSKLADLTLCSRISVPSAWDSSVVTLLLLEAIVAKTQKSTWDSTKNRVEELENLFDQTKFFRKF
ncbi:MurR/RpiR family transcriptional regulator [Sneathiella glossodoripedis]|uniref:MurR/RpiR family transcriptional regulator n=1 Tax=Sneathiella glossodoripedis TaxID=418853 RepID=UPI00046FFEF7|nr:MurR/RpiR family transcriptional regulator [Sneathiella glossodoripedis]